MPRLRDDGTIYLGDNGRLTCGRSRCAGMAAAYTGRDLSGQPVVEVTPEMAREMEAALADIGLRAACEGCGRVAPTSHVVRS